MWYVVGLQSCGILGSPSSVVCCPVAELRYSRQPLKCGMLSGCRVAVFEAAPQVWYVVGLQSCGILGSPSSVVCCWVAELLYSRQPFKCGMLLGCRVAVFSAAAQVWYVVGLQNCGILGSPSSVVCCWVAELRYSRQPLKCGMLLGCRVAVLQAAPQVWYVVWFQSCGILGSPSSVV